MRTRTLAEGRALVCLGTPAAVGDPHCGQGPLRGVWHCFTTSASSAASACGR